MKQNIRCKIQSSKLKAQSSHFENVKYFKDVICYIIFIWIFLIGSKVYAGGPLLVQDGASVTYGTRPLVYRIDQGPFGMFSNAEAVNLVETLLMDWENVSTTTIRFERGEPQFLDLDVDGTNFGSILEPEEGFLGYTPIVFDSDGSIVEKLIGIGASNFVIGFAGPVAADSGEFKGQIAESSAVFNGKFINGIKASDDNELSVDTIKGTIIHEVGHGIGLDHSQINVEALEAFDIEIKNSVPLMFPVAVNDLFIIRQDDASAVSFLYPKESELLKFGKIEGKVLREDGFIPVVGLNVIARNVNDSKIKATSCVSDFFKNNTGTFILPALPPGDYKIEVEPIHPSFTSKSGVGPYTEDEKDRSFQNPVVFGFYSGNNKPLSPDREALIVSLKEGQTVSAVNIIASGETSFIATNINEVESNNSPEEAKDLMSGEITSGTISLNDAGSIEFYSNSLAMISLSDLYKFSIEEPSVLNIFVENSNGNDKSDVDIYVLDKLGKKVLTKSENPKKSNELISDLLLPGEYLLGIGLAGGSSSDLANYKLAITSVPIAETLLPSKNILLRGLDLIILEHPFNNKFKFSAESFFNQEEKSKCKIRSDGFGLKISPSVIVLGKEKTRKTFTVKIPSRLAKKIISENAPASAPISISCKNEVADDTNITIFPIDALNPIIESANEE